MEKPFHIKINGGEEFELNRHNSALVRYLGNLALHDHVQLATEYGTGYIFPEVDGYDEVAEYMEENDYPMAINCPQVPEHVIEAHAQTIEGFSDNDVDEEVEKWRRLFENRGEE